MINRRYRRPQKLLAELAGTCVAVLAPSGAMALGAWLQNANRAWLGPPSIALAYGLAYGACLAAFGRISGGHFNPAVTVAYWTTHRLGLFDALSYIAAQLAGATAAAYSLRIVFPAAAPRPPLLAPEITRGPAMLIEAGSAAALTLVLWAAIAGRKHPRWRLGGIASAIVIAAAAALAFPWTGGLINPARAFGPAAAARQWTYQGVYWVGPVAGSVLAASIYDLLLARHRPP